MDAATILVLVLSAGVVALLAWFEVNSRQNEKRKESMSTPADSSREPLKMTNQRDPDAQKRKAA